MNAAKQRLLDLQVNEVSLVDFPANESEFLIKKARDGGASEDNAMGSETKVETPNTQDDMVLKAIAAFGDILKAKGKGKMPPWMEDEEGDDEEGKKRKADLRKAFQSVLDAAAALGEPNPAPTGDVAKATETDPEPGTHIHVQPDGTVVLKGGPQFSKKRTEALKSAMMSMLGVMKEADPGGFAEVMSKFAAQGGSGLGMTKSDPDPKVETTKTAEDPVLKALEALNANVTGLVGRVEAVEKAQTVSKSLGDDGDGKKPVTKAEESKQFWAGLL